MDLAVNEGKTKYMFSTSKDVRRIDSRILCAIKKHGQDERLVEYQFCRTREVSITQFPLETIIAPVGKSDPSFDLQADIIFGGNGGAKINKFLDCIKSIVIGRNPRINFIIFFCQKSTERKSLKEYLMHFVLMSGLELAS